MNHRQEYPGDRNFRNEVVNKNYTVGSNIDPEAIRIQLENENDQLQGKLSMLDNQKRNLESNNAFSKKPHQNNNSLEREHLDRLREIERNRENALGKINDQIESLEAYRKKVLEDFAIREKDIIENQRKIDLQKIEDFKKEKQQQEQRRLAQEEENKNQYYKQKQEIKNAQIEELKKLSLKDKVENAVKKSIINCIKSFAFFA